MQSVLLNSFDKSTLSHCVRMYFRVYISSWLGEHKGQVLTKDDTLGITILLLTYFQARILCRVHDNISYQLRFKLALLFGGQK